MTGKQLEMLKEVVPKASLVAVLWNPANAGNAPQIQQAHDAARALGVRLQPLGARGSSEIDSAFATMTSTQSGAVIVLVDAMLLDHRTQIADLAAQRRLPAVYGLRDHAAAGGLMAYGPNRLDIVRRAATYVDKILKGAKPADLPIEQPTKFELVINLKTAKALGLTIPPSAMTASVMSEDRQKIMVAGFDGYQSKPINVTGFVAAVAQLLERPPNMKGKCGCRRSHSCWGRTR
jgi:putative tryptophan/tyrosine transport system substrate-binding protein